MVSQTERRKATRVAIMTAAASIINDRGFNNCSIAVIASETTYSTGAIQHHFKSKDDLLYSLVTEYIFSTSVSTPAIVESMINESLEKRCRLVVESMWSYYGHDNYSLVWEVILGSKNNKNLKREIGNFFRAAEVKAEANIHEFFSDLSFSKEYVIELRRHLSAQLRGISLLRFTSNIDDEIHTQLEYVIELVILKIRNDISKRGLE